MMKNEFIEILNEIAPGHTAPTEKEYHDIEIVYTYHPLIGTKEKIVRLWVDMGQMIIDDMMERALEVKAAEAELDRARRNLEEAKRYLKRAEECYDSLFKGLTNR